MEVCTLLIRRFSMPAWSISIVVSFTQVLRYTVCFALYVSSTTSSYTSTQSYYKNEDMNEESEIVFVTVIVLYCILSAFQEALNIIMTRRFVHYFCN